MECKVAYQTLSDVKQRAQYDRQQGAVSWACRQTLRFSVKGCVAFGRRVHEALVLAVLTGHAQQVYHAAVPWRLARIVSDCTSTVALCSLPGV